MDSDSEDVTLCGGLDKKNIMRRKIGYTLTKSRDDDLISNVDTSHGVLHSMYSKPV